MFLISIAILTVWILTPVLFELFDCLSLIKGAVGFLGGKRGTLFLGGNGGGCNVFVCAIILLSCQHNKYAYNGVKKNIYKTLNYLVIDFLIH